VSLSKRHFEEVEARGFDHRSTTICSDCLADIYLSNFARSHAAEKRCSYCGRKGDRPISVEFDEIAEVILSGIKTEWTDPANELPFESAEGGYLFQDDILNTTELLSDVLRVSDNSDFVDDLASAIHVDSWCRSDFFGLRPEEDMQMSWDRFCFVVKHKVRHSFLAFGDAFGLDGLDSGVRPGHVLTFLSDLFRQYCPVRSLKESSILFRVREGRSYATASELSPPHRLKATQSNRMSPAGIPLFYGAFHPETAALETRRDVSRVFRGVVGRWRVRKELLLLDLSSMPSPPSLYDTNRDETDYSNLSFLQQFARDISRPIKNLPTEDVDYVPTQVLTEYIRYGFTTADGLHVDGLVYESSTLRGRGACVIFCERENCVDKGSSGEPFTDVWLELESSESIEIGPGTPLDLFDGTRI
jgi:hypothetical protein